MATESPARSENTQIPELKKNKALYTRHVKQAKNSGSRTFFTNATNTFGKQYKAAFQKAIPPANLMALKNSNTTGG
ncbi:hypothetical protein AVEN_17528-1 [Araneus ventricosus]|uniref:Uncharacterized protein n=1 Tax=Araneus ventricosus TaxID=182803 RepID=A0A4Y2HF76_ARAVE|nr:hypothetical protein AVEN_17528-1 [Araneus ventricosus]